MHRHPSFAAAAILQVNVPVQLPGQGPLSIAMLGLAKSELSLLSIAARLAPLIAQAVPTLDQAPQDEQEPSKSARSASNAAASTPNGKCPSLHQQMDHALLAS